ncbi:MAG: AMP-binding protein [Deltaproteobacteria bacterium]|nr:MAG: AMP-binding protein [Deltaproteobacteria bacterium]
MIGDAKTLGELIDRAAETWPDHEAIVYEDKRVSYRQLQERANRLAGALFKLGVRKGDKVSVLFTNLPQWAYAEFAIDKIGGIVVPVNTRYSVDEIEYILNHSDSTTLIMMDNFQKTNYVAMAREICPELDASEPGHLKSEKLPFLKNVIVFGDRRYRGTFDFSELIEIREGKVMKDLNKAQEEVRPADIAHLPYTSGTTGKPKGVMTTHQQYIRFNLGFIKGIGKFTEKDRLCVAAPFSHNFGNSQGILTPAFCGAASVIIEAFDARKCLELIEKERCTFFAGSPTMYIKMLRDEHFSKHDLSSLRSGLIAAAPAPVALIEEIVARMGIKTLVNGFGMTENSVGTSMTRPGDPPEVVSKTVGKPLWPDYEIKVIDINTGENLPQGAEGELCTRGPLIMKGYYKMPEETAKLIDQEGWFHTGDMAIIDEGGYIRITGRLKDVFMPGGLNVSPEEVENVLFTHPRVKQVAVLGVPDEVMGEVGAAFVELKEGKTVSDLEIIDFCKGRLANFKVPRHIIFTDDFPMTTSGKIQKFILRDRAIERLGLSC